MKKIKLGQLWEESKVVSENPNSEKRIKVKLNVQGVEKRPDKNDQKGATRYFIRKAGQFIYGKQNLHKGAFGVIPKELDNFESSSDIPAFDIIEECNPEWIYYYFKQGDFYKDLEMYSKGTGSKRIHPYKISHLEIPFPDRKEQERIIEKIKSHELNNSKLDNEINYQLKLLSSLRQAILSEAVQGKLVKQNPNDEPATELLKKIKKEKEKLIKEGKIKKGKELPTITDDEIPYDLPNGWEWCRLGDVLINRDGERIPVSKEERETKEKIYDYYGASGVIDKIDSYLFDKELLLIGEDGANLINRSTPIAFIAKGKYWVNNHAHVLDGISLDLLEYTEIFINSSDLKPYITGTAQPKMNQAKMNQILIPLPPLPEQLRIVEKVDSLMGFCDELELRIKENKINSEGLMSGVLREVFSS
jgi:type I restriction enzyme S subunit